MAFYNVNSENGNLIPVAGGTLYADTPIGTIIGSGVSASNPPAGYLYCDGRAVSRTTYAALFAAIGTAFGTGDGSTTFNLPDGREATFKGAGLTGLSNNHYDSDGVALGEFVDDQIQDHDHYQRLQFSTEVVGQIGPTYAEGTVSGDKMYGEGIHSGRSGATTEVKAFGVNFFIKAKHVGIPSDFIDAIDDAIADTTVDTVTNGDMHPVTSNAVYDALAPVDISNSVTVCSGIVIRNGTLHVVKSGHTVNVSFIIDNITDTTSVYLDILTGLPTPKVAQEISSICFTNSTMYYCGYYFNGTLRMYERTDGFSRVQFTYVCV